MAQGVSGETLKQAFNDFQTFRKAGKIVVDYGLLAAIAAPFSLRTVPKDRKNLTAKQKKQIQRHDQQEFYLANLPSYLNKWLPIYGIDTAIRAAHFLSQACCETFNFAEVTEDTDGLKYDAGTRIGKRLGNTKIGDGPAFIGRGLLHLTGRGNYEAMSDLLKVNIVDSPNTVASDINLSVRTACEYWRMRSINIPADKDDFNKVMILINGGHNGRDQRYAALQRAKKKLGIV